MTRRAAAGLLGLGILAAAWAGWAWLSPADVSPLGSPATAVQPSGSASPGARPAAAPTPGTRAPTTAPSPRQTVTPTGTPPGRDVAASRVDRFEFPTAGYSSDVKTMAVGDAGAIIPPDFRNTWWIRDRGVAPSSRATDTTYLACHTDAKKSASAVPCNRVTLDNVPVGAEVRVTTDAEQLTYRITDARKVARDDFASDAEVWGVHPGRLVWVSCYLSEGRRSDFNIVVIAELVPA